MKCLENRRGQSMIELSFVALAVIAGIVIGGPYLLDSINSHFKIWDTAVSDSTNDRLVKANKEDLNIPSQACVPQGKAPGSCGDPRGNCQETQRFFTHQYTPVGCQTNFSCEDDSECCSIPQLTQLCWRKNDPQNGARLWASTTDITADVASKGFISCYPNGVYTPSASNCKNGDQLYQFSCGNKKNMFVGLPNRDKCLPVCNWDAIPPNSTACPNQGNGDLMADSQDPSIIETKTPCSTFSGDCQAQCNDGYKRNNGTCTETACELVTTFNTGASQGSYYSSARYDEVVRFISDVCADDFNYSYRVDGGPWQGNCPGPIWTCNYSDKNKHDGGGTAQCARINERGHQIEIYLWDGGDGHDNTQISGYIYLDGVCSATRNGGWGEWGPCTAPYAYTCLGSQNRSCNNPAPAYGGENCPNFANAYYQICNLPIGTPACFCRDNPNDASCQSSGGDGR